MKLNKRNVALLVSLAVLLTVIAGATLAFIIANTQSIKNTFTPANVACEVTKTDGVYTVTNTGDAECFVRVAIVVTWTKTVDGNTVISAQKPTLTTSLKDNNDWIEVDGYYYYKKAIPAFTNNATPSFEISAEEKEGYTLSIEVVASAIQATDEAVKDWSNDTVVIVANGTTQMLESKN